MKDIVTITELFNIKFDSIVDEVEFSLNWANDNTFNCTIEGTFAVQLYPGEEKKCLTKDVNPRKMIFIGTQHGTVVVFQHYGSKANNVSYMATNKLRQFMQLSNDRLSIFDLQYILGLPDKVITGKQSSINIGQRINAQIDIYVQELNDMLSGDKTKNSYNKNGFSLNPIC